MYLNNNIENFIMFFLLNSWLISICMNLFHLERIIITTHSRIDLVRNYIYIRNKKKFEQISFSFNKLYSKCLFNNMTSYYIYIYIFILFILWHMFINKANVYFNYKTFTESLIWESYFYKISELWNNHQGSLFLWFFILVIYKFVMHSYYNYMWYNKILITLSIFIELFILIFFIFNSNLFIRIELYNNVVINLVPVLKDFLLIIHPPFLYLGYLAVSITFNICLFYILFSRAINIFWYIKKNIMISWILLSFGICLGSWWAYQELGWGGWWYWDPIENISILPWFLLILVFHYVFTKRAFSSFKDKRLLFMLFSIYLLNLIGTFTVRMGLLNSVHSFVNNNVYIHFFFIGVVQSMFFLFFFYRYKQNNIHRLVFKINYNFLLKITCYIIIFIFISILILTYIPLFVPKISVVNYTFFNRIFEPWIIVLILLYIYFLFYKNNVFDFISLSFYVLLLFMMSNVFHYEKGFISFWCLTLFVGLIYVNFIYLKKTSQYNFISVLIHNLYAMIILTIIISKNYELSSVLFINLNDKYVVYNYLFELTHTFFTTNVDLKTNFFQYDVKNPLDNLSKVYPEKRYYTESDTFLNKNNTFSNLLWDISIYPGIGNFINGWVFKINMLPLVSFIWFFSLILFSISIIYYLNWKKRSFSFNLKKSWANTIYNFLRPLL